MLLVIVYMMNDSIIVKETSIKTKKVENSIKVVVLADFHCGNAEKVLKHIQQINPDLVVIPGDLVDENWSLAPVNRLLNGLKKWSCVFVSGNHEYKKGRTYTSYHQMNKMLENAGILQLNNEGKIFELNHQKIWIGGVQDHCSDKTKNPDELDCENIRKTCLGMQEELFNVVLMHRPEQYELFKQYPVDLLISGHAHGGQWRFPGINGVFAPQQGLFPERAGGSYLMKSGLHLVSRGLAHYWFLPRINNRREINVIKIEKAD